MAALPTLRQLEYAVAVAEHKSFARGARAGCSTKCAAWSRSRTDSSIRCAEYSA